MHPPPPERRQTLQTIQTLHWIVCERSQRWSNTIRRFHHDLVGKEIQAKVTTQKLTSEPPVTRPSDAIVFLWEVDRSNLVDSLDHLIQIGLSTSNRLQLVASVGLSLTQRLALSELNIAMFLQKPEEMPRCRPILQGYFARLGDLVD